MNWTNAKQANAYQFLNDPYHKLDDARKIRKPVHVPHMYSCTLLGLVTETTATEKEKGVYHTERTIWTSKRACDKLQKRHKQFIENQVKPRWLDGAISERDKATTAEEKKLRKAANLKTPGAAAAGEPPDWSDDGLAYHEPKPKPKSKPWDPMNRKPGEESPRGWLDNLEDDFDGCEDKDRKAGVMACSMKRRRK